MTYKPDFHQVTFVLPIFFTTAEIVFSISPKSLDNISFQIAPNNKPIHAVSTEILHRGQWLAQLSWSDGKSQFFSEKLIVVS
jgi:hypothetical protein